MPLAVAAHILLWARQGQLRGSRRWRVKLAVTQLLRHGRFDPFLPHVLRKKLQLRRLPSMGSSIDGCASPPGEVRYGGDTANVAHAPIAPIGRASAL